MRTKYRKIIKYMRGWGVPKDRIYKLMKANFTGAPSRSEVRKVAGEPNKNALYREKLYYIHKHVNKRYAKREINIMQMNYLKGAIIKVHAKPHQSRLKVKIPKGFRSLISDETLLEDLDEILTDADY